MISASTAGYYALAASVIGAGVSAYASVQSGKSQNILAQLNAASQAKAAREQLQISQAQYHMQKNAAATEMQLRAMEAQAAENNAVSIENKVITDDQINRANLSRKRLDYARMQGEQRAAIIGSGIVESTGTPLDLLAETAATIQQDQEEGFYANELSRRGLFREADMTRLGGQLGLAGASLDRQSKIAAAGIDAATGRLNYNSGMRESKISRLTGSYAQSAGNLNAAATLFNGASSAYGSYASYSNLKNPPKSTYRGS